MDLDFEASDGEEADPAAVTGMPARGRSPAGRGSQSCTSRSRSRSSGRSPGYAGPSGSGVLDSHSNGQALGVPPGEQPARTPIAFRLGQPPQAAGRTQQGEAAQLRHGCAGMKMRVCYQQRVQAPRAPCPGCCPRMCEID
jgi:hypothetical protein